MKRLRAGPKMSQRGRSGAVSTSSSSRRNRFMQRETRYVRAGRILPFFSKQSRSRFLAFLCRAAACSSSVICVRCDYVVKRRSMSKVVRFVPLCALSVALFASPGRADPRRPTHVACVGDSITAGANASDVSKNYVSQLQVLLGNTVQVKNFGHSGATLLSAGFGDLPYNQQTEYTGATDFVSNAGAGAV